ncbi:MAG: carbon-nitrogen hydrolase family protein [Cyanobacteria bacterium J06626_18]
MKLGAAQLRPVAGDIAANTTKHLQLIELAITQNADLVYFPELSLTGYEPRLAKALAIASTDSYLDVFQQYSDTHNIIIGVGLPIAVGAQVQIGMVWFAPNAPRRSYGKQQLHADELPFFVPGNQQLVLTLDNRRLTPAICYESLQVNHADNAAQLRTDVYLASVAKPAGGLAKAMRHYPAIARKHSLYVILSNCVGPNDDFVSVGQSAVWNDQGELLTQLDSESEGVVMVDMADGKAEMQAMANIGCNNNAYQPCT